MFRESALALVRTHLSFTADVSPSVSHVSGGRSAGLELLKRIDPRAYGATRNFLAGAVTRLSPYLRHGCLSLTEVRDAALSKATRWESAKLIQELAWRDYYQRMYDLLGSRIADDLEPYKSGTTAADYAPELPDDIASSTTGLGCIDDIAGELRTTGYLHNHARMWMAAYVVHFRRVSWQAGADWFLSHLLDGDVASNHLSWQWVAGTFSSKPYIFNRENLERYSDGRYCGDCPSRHKCPFEASYEQLTERLFPGLSPAAGEAAEDAPPRRLSLKVLAEDRTEPDPAPTEDAVVWAHEDALSSTHPAYATGLPTIAVLDAPEMRRRRYALKRAVFIAESASDLVADLAPRRDAELVAGDPLDLVRAFASRHGAQTVVVPETPSVRIRELAQILSSDLRVVWVAPRPFVALAGQVDYARFSRYWNKAERALK